MQTALRETEEEAGFKVNHLRITDFRKELHYVVRNKPKTVVYWLAELIDPATPVIMSNEHKDYRWLLIEDACKIAQFSDMQDLLLECDSYLKASASSVSN
jgi:bis(5'-nucleosidyl)-tetraphosphatase